MGAYHLPVPTPEPFATYRFVADGAGMVGPIRSRIPIFHKPLVLTAFVVFGLALGTVESFATYSASVPEYTGRIIWIGVVWGLYWLVFVAVVLGLLLWSLVSWERRRIRRLFPEGSSTEVTVDEESVVLDGPTGVRTLTFDQMTMARTSGSFLVLCLRRPRLRTALIPCGVLSDAAVDYVTARAQGARPAPDIEPRGGDLREFVVPPGWAGHVATVYTWSMLRRPAFLERFGVATLAILFAAVLLHPAWAALVPLLLGILLLGVWAPTRRNVLTAAPEGSVATTEFLDDRFISRNAAGAREIRYADLGSVTLSGDVVLLRVISGPTRVMPKALFADDVLARLTSAAADRRRA